MNPDVGFPVVALLFLFLFFHLLVLFGKFRILHRVLQQVVPFVHGNNDHFVVLHACLKHVVECEYLALLRDLNEAQTRLTQIELSVNLGNLLRGVG